MSLGSMFSSPGKQASQAASASGQIADQEISKLLNYTDTHQQQLRDAIAQQGANPYFGAAQQLNPQAYYVNPSDTATFSAGGGPASGLTTGQAQVQGSPFAPPPPDVILAPPPGSAPGSGPVGKPTGPTPPSAPGNGNPFQKPPSNGPPIIPPNPKGPPVRY